jgi:hypothetical protein
VGYRVDERVRCERCEAVLAESEGTYGADGLRLCRVCHSASLIEHTERSLVDERGRAAALGPAWAGWRERSAWWGWSLMSPAILCALAALSIWVEHEVSGGSCSELGCLGTALAAMAGVIVGVPSVLIGVVVLPAGLRVRGLLIGIAALVASVLPLVVLG